MIDSNMTMEEFVRFNAPCMPAATGNLWGLLETMGREIDKIEQRLEMVTEKTTTDHS